eukprot:TRINITY_DN763_c0_g1_i3.p1 TRINITY_DN763_c0_g1~~TRINITY_DN763_c0_g1_i3.p1  ORF type:complete len:2503 (+),score=411.34 TRINITY_DN763_c0_g1_i3:95-7603(+)
MILVVLFLLASLPDEIFYREVNNKFVKVTKDGEYLGYMNDDECPPYCGEVSYMGDGLYSRRVSALEVSPVSEAISSSDFNQFYVTVDGNLLYPNPTGALLEVGIQPVVNVTLVHPRDQLFEGVPFSVDTNRVALIPPLVEFEGVSKIFQLQLQSDVSEFNLILGSNVWKLKLKVRVTCACNGHGNCLSTGCHCYQDEVLGYWEAPDCLTCSPSYGGPYCRDSCPTYFSEPCNGHGVCQTGSQKVQPFCICDPNWTGSACDDCIGNFYGYNCDQLCPSSCKTQCYNKNERKRTGTGCVCPSNKARDSNGTCSGCLPGYYAAVVDGDCDYKCTCSAQGVCNATGYCDCQIGFYGPRCDLTCKSDCLGFFNGQCSWSNNDCQPNTTCLSSCVHGDCNGTNCLCNYGWTGPNCDIECPKSKSGDPCFGNGICTYDAFNNRAQCVCNGNYDLTQSCSTCLPGWSGKECDLSCLGCSPSATCMDGVCVCNSNTCGPNCTLTSCLGECEKGKFGPNCDACGPCEVSGGLCDDGKNGTGICLCPRHRYGSSCQYSCLGSDTDGVPCSGSGHCSDNGCVCNEGYSGEFCELQCGCLHRNSSVLTPMPTCLDNITCTCTPADNGCVCNEGYSGEFCELQCGCLHRNSSVLTPMPTCLDNITCTCTPGSGFVGPQCGHSCPGLYTGESCLGNGECEYSDSLQLAVCRCHNGWTGPTCGICSPGWGGAKCDEKCPSYKGEVCSGATRGECIAMFGVTPTCTCLPGFEGIACQCPSCSGLMICSDDKDFCHCPPNRDGPGCSSCAAGYYEPGCVCDCSGHGTCQKPGICECDERYSGLKCEICDDGFIGESCEVLNKPPQKEDSLDLPFYKESGIILVPSTDGSSIMDETVIVADAFYQTWSFGGNPASVFQAATCSDPRAVLVHLCDDTNSVYSVINNCNGSGITIIGFDKGSNGTIFTTTVNVTLDSTPLVDAASAGDRLFTLQTNTSGCFLQVRSLTSPITASVDKKLGDYICEKIAVFTGKELLIVAGGFEGLLKGFDFQGNNDRIIVSQPPEFTLRWTAQSLAVDEGENVFLVVDTVTSVTLVHYKIQSTLTYVFIQPAEIALANVPVVYPSTAHAIACDPYAQELYISLTNADSYLIRYRYRYGVIIDGILDFGQNRGNSHLVSFSIDDQHRILYALDYTVQIKITSFLMYTVREFDPPTVSPKTIVAAIGSGFRDLPGGPLLHDSGGVSMESAMVLNETHAIFTVVGTRSGCHGDTIYMALEGGSNQARRFASHTVTGADFDVVNVVPTVVAEYDSKVISVFGTNFQDSPYLGCRFQHRDSITVVAASAFPKLWVNRSSDPIVSSPFFTEQVNLATYISPTEIHCMSPPLSAFKNISLEVTIDGQQFKNTGFTFATAGPLSNVVIERLNPGQGLIESDQGTVTIPPVLVSLVDESGVLIQSTDTVKLTLTPTWRLSEVERSKRIHGLATHCGAPIQKECTSTAPETFHEIEIDLTQSANISGEWSIHNCDKKADHELVLLASAELKADPTIWNSSQELVFPIPLGKPSQLIFGSISSVTDAFRISSHSDICLFPLPDKVKIEPVILIADFAGNVLSRSEFGSEEGEINVRGAIVPVSKLGEAGPPVAGLIKSEADSVKLPSMSAKHQIGVIYSISVNATFGNATHHLSSNSFASNCFGGTDECCFPNADCNLIPGWVVAKPGRYFPAGERWCSYECPEGACEGFEVLTDETELSNAIDRTDVTNIQVRCNEGAVPGSPLCSICEEGYGRSLDSKCQKCPDNIAIFIIMVVGAIVGLTVYSVFTLQQGVSAQSSIVLRMIFSHLQVFSNLLNIGIKWQDTEAYGALKGLLVAGEGTSLSPSANVDCYFAKVLSPQLDVKYAVIMSSPLVFIPVGVVIYLVSKLCSPRNSHHRSNNWVSKEESRRQKETKALEEGKHIALANKLNNYKLSEILIVVGLVVFFVMYQMLAVQSASMFACIQLNTEDGSTQRFMRMNLNEACEGSLRNAGLIMLIIYGLGVPFFLCLAIVRYRARHSEEATKMVFAFLLGGFKGGIFKFWQCVVMLRKLLVVITLAYFEVTIDSEGCDHSKTVDDKVKIYAILWILTIFLILQIKLEPYARHAHNLTETVAHASLVLTIHLGLIYFVNPSHTVKELVMYCIVIINLAVFVVFIWQWIAAVKVDAKNKLGVADGEKLVDAARKAALARASKFVDLAIAKNEDDDPKKSTEEEEADLKNKQLAKERKKRQKEEADRLKEAEKKRAAAEKELQIQNDFASVRRQVEELEALEKERRRQEAIQEIVISDPTIPPKVACKTQRRKRPTDNPDDDDYDDEDPYTYKPSEIEVVVDNNNPLARRGSTSTSDSDPSPETIVLTDTSSKKTTSVPIQNVKEFGLLTTERMTGRILQNTIYLQPSTGSKVVVTFDTTDDARDWHRYLSSRVESHHSATASSYDEFDDRPLTVSSGSVLNFKNLSPPKRKKAGTTTSSTDSTSGLLSLLQPAYRTTLKNSTMK